MHRVIVNLLTNAREAIKGTGEVELGAELVAPGAGRAGSLFLTVRDTGRGMTEEFIHTGLFKPFATTKPAGLGVGLAQCKAIVEAHGGTISVESRPGRGTTFRVQLPLAVPAGAVVRPATREATAQEPYGAEADAGAREARQ
jgi:signal transduction histidine kinase